ncbi:hypothetical protein MMO39_15575 [Acinetobacter modestus]|uniref:hypothetical protein n=1 Tax=Acinetobacter modestus TaxID=1776740 RepID=UPI001F4A38B6|nr:hypothetical protein [Acinetobacter modestus]MCH7388704.1 hypothetical protein [Acinetobacter modestus]
MSHAKLISTQGVYLEAQIEVNDHLYYVYDEFSLYDIKSKINSLFDFEWTIELSDDESWDEIFANNSKQKYGLEHIGGWRYRAFGRIVAVHPVVVDCLVLQVEDVILSSDECLIGEWVGFTISRLGCYGI